MQHPPTHKGSMIKRCWDWLVFDGEEDTGIKTYQLGLLRALVVIALVVTIIFQVFLSIIDPETFQWNDPDNLIGLIGGLLLTLSHFLSRIKKMRAATVWVVLIMNLTILFSVGIRPSPDKISYLYFLILPTIISNLFLPFWVSFAAAVSSILGVIVLDIFFFPGPETIEMVTAFLCISAALSLTTTRHRDNLESKRQANLRTYAESLETLRRANLDLSDRFELSAFSEKLLQTALNLAPGAQHAQLFLFEDNILVDTIAIDTSGKKLDHLPKPFFTPPPDDDHIFTIPDFETETRFNTQEAYTTGAMILFSLVYRGAVVGLITIYFAQPQIFDPEEIQVFRLLADQAAAAIANARLFESERAQRQVAQTLTRSASLLTQSLDLSSTLDQILDQALNLIGCDAVNLMLVDDNLPKIIRMRGYSPGDLILQDVLENISLETPNLDQMRQSRASITIANTAEDPGWAVESAPDWVRSYAGAPLFIDEQLIGFINLDSRFTNFFSQKMLNQLQVFANHAATAIHNARLYESEHKARNLADAVVKVAKKTSSTPDIQEVLVVFLEEMGNILPFTTAAIIIYELNTPLIMVIKGLDSPSVTTLTKQKAQEMQVRSRLLQRVLETKQAIFLPDVRQEPDWLITEEVEYIQSWMAIPLTIQDEVIGILTLDSDERGTYWEEQLSLGESLASEAANAIHTAKLFSEARLRITELGVLHAIASHGPEAADEDQFLAYATKLIHQAFNFSNFGILMIDEQRGVMSTHPSYISRIHEEPIEIPLGSGITGKVAVTGNTLRINHVDEYPNYIKVDPNVHSELCTPIKVNEKVVGVLNAESVKLNAFSIHDERLMTTLAGQIALILTRIRAKASEERYARQLEILNALASEMTGILSEIDICQLVTRRLVEEFGYYSCALMTLSQDGKEVILQCGAGGYHYERVPPGKFSQSTEIGLVGKTVKSRKPVVSNDVENDPDYHTWGNTEIKSEMIVPLFKDQEISGILLIAEDRPHAFDESEANALTTLADQMAVALEKARLFETERLQRQQAESLQNELTEALEREKQINLIIRRLSEGIGMESVLEDLVRLACQAVNADSGSLGLISEDGQAMDFPYTHNPLRPAPQDTAPKGVGVAWSIAESRQAILLEDYKHHPLALNLPEANRAFSFIGTPVLSGDEVIGSLAIYNLTPERIFSQRDLELIESIGRQAGIAIHNARLFEIERRQRQQAETLQNEITEALEREKQINLIIRRISEGIGIDSVLKDLVGLACQAVNADSGSLGLISADGQTMDFPYAYNPQEDFPQRIMPRGEGLAWHIAETGESLLLSNYQDHPASFSQSQISTVCCFIGVPVVWSDQIIGSLAVYNHSPDKKLSPRDLSLIESIGRQAGIAIHNARLFTQTKEAYLREQYINEVTRTISSALDPDTIIQRLSEYVTELTGGSIVSIAIIDPHTQEIEKLFSHNRPQGVDPRPRGRDSGLMWQVVETGESILMEDYSQHPKALPDWVASGINAAMIVPITTQNILTGVMGVLSDSLDKRFTQRDLELIESIGRQAGVALHNARLFEETTRRSQELSALYEIALATGSLLDIQALLDQLHLKVKQLIDPDSYGVVLCNEDSSEYEIMMALDKDTLVEEAIGMRASFDTGLTGYMLKQRKTLLINNMETDELPNTPIQFNQPIMSWLGIPLISHDRLIGGLLVQSFRPDAFNPNDVRFLESLSSQVAVALENANLYEELEDAFVQTVLALANAMDVRDSYTNDHSQRIAVWTEQIGRTLGCTEKEIEDFRWASLLHDIGKIGVPDEILLKPGKLTKEEYKIIQRHPALGAEIIAPVKKLEDVAPIIRGHQERYDGAGYPDKLKGEQIPLGARILSVVDAYVAMTDDRVYRPGRSHEEALEELTSLKGQQFDPQVVDIFLSIIEKE